MDNKIIEKKSKNLFVKFNYNFENLQHESQKVFQVL
jgi:hypothetical protein